jgi:hypothetical protein
MWIGRSAPISMPRCRSADQMRTEGTRQQCRPERPSFVVTFEVIHLGRFTVTPQKEKIVLYSIRSMNYRLFASTAAVVMPSLTYCVLILSLR